MKILVKKFYLAHEGQLYKEGDVVDIRDAAWAKRLLAQAGGDLEVYREADVEDVHEDAAAQDAEPRGGTEEEQEASDSARDGAGTELPSFDPAAAVQTTKSKAKGKTR